MNLNLCPSCFGRSDDGLVCPQCAAAARRDLMRIPSLMRELDTTLTRQSQTGTGNGGKGAVRPLPFDGNASEVGDTVRTTIVTWVREMHLGDVWPADTMPAMCRWLIERTERIRGHAAGAQMVDEVAYSVRILLRAIDLRPQMVYLGPCQTVIGTYQDEDGEHPELCRYQMYARARDEAFDCPECRAIYNVAAKRAEMLELVKDQTATVGTCAQVLAVFGVEVKAETIHNWARLGQRNPPRLWRVGLNEKGEAVYRIGDIEELVRDAIDRRAEKVKVG
jgi:hypothetical protein